MHFQRVNAQIQWCLNLPHLKAKFLLSAASKLTTKSLIRLGGYRISMKKSIYPGQGSTWSTTLFGTLGFQGEQLQMSEKLQKPAIRRAERCIREGFNIPCQKETLIPLLNWFQDSFENQALTYSWQLTGKYTYFLLKVFYLCAKHKGPTEKGV